MIRQKQIENDAPLLNSFNNRERESFGVVYKKYYKEFSHFANRLFQDTNESAEDILQDIFISIWNNKNRSFISFENLKVYIYVSLKNKLREICNHKKCVEKYETIFRTETSFSTQIAESEVFSIISHSIELLPEECAKVFRLHVDGWEVKDIAKALNKTESTVYKQKREAIDILKSKLPKSQFPIILPFII